MMRQRSGFEQRIRTAVRRRMGLWPLYELRNRIVKLPDVLRWSRFEVREVERLSSLVARLPEARIAVVIPTFRRADELRRAVDSVLAQDFEDFVVVVVDDGGGATQGLPDDPRLTITSLSRNTAVLGLVRNVGIGLSRSRYVAFLDDDNTWTTDHLRRCVEVLDAGVDLVYTGVERSFPDGRILDVLSTPFDRRRLADESFVDASSIAVRRTDKTRFSRIPRTHKTLPQEDWEFVYRQSRRSRVVHVDRVTVRYLVNPESFYTNWTDEPKSGPSRS